MKGKTADQVIPLLALCRLDKDVFPGIRSSLLAADPTLLSSDISQIEQRMQQEQRIRSTIEKHEGGPSSIPSANRSTQSRANSGSTTPSNNNSTSSTHPTSRIFWKQIYSYIESHPNTCLGCFAETPAHLQHGCPACAKKGWVVIKNPTQANQIWSDYENRPSGRSGSNQPAGRGGRGQAGRGGRGRGRGGGNVNRVSEDGAEECRGA